MTESIVLPELGESVREAKVIKILKQAGDFVKKNEPLLEVATDKVDSTIDATCEGVIAAVLCQEGAVVSVGQALVEIRSNQISPPVSLPVQAAEYSDVKDTFLSPIVSAMISEHQITPQELAQIQGTGRNARIRKEDISHFLARRASASSQASVMPSVLPTEAEARENGAHLALQKEGQALSDTEICSDVPVHKTPRHYYGNSFAAIEQQDYEAIIRSKGDARNKIEIVEMSRMRRIIAKHMRDSLEISAHATLFSEFDVTRLVQWRTRNKQAFEHKYQEKITYTPIIVSLLAKVLRKHPIINSSVEGHNIVLKEAVNIGIATALSSGDLIVPVVKSVSSLDLITLTQTVNALVQKARNGQLKYADIEGGTFTMSNIGTFDCLSGTPIIQQPQVAILAVGAIKKKPVVVEVEGACAIVPRDIIHLSFGFDHRIIDGMLAGQFLNDLGQALMHFEHPDV